jgi:hypothetical protein
MESIGKRAGFWAGVRRGRYVMRDASKGSLVF